MHHGEAPFVLLLGCLCNGLIDEFDVGVGLLQNIVTPGLCIIENKELLGVVFWPFYFLPHPKGLQVFKA